MVIKPTNPRIEEVWELVTKLQPQEQQIIRRRLNETWAKSFGRVLDSIEARLPRNISEEEIQADIEAAIREVRESKS